jgi:MFS family permease
MLLHQLSVFSELKAWINQIACGGIFGPSCAIVAHWFKKKRGRALAFMAMGSSLGGTSIPIAAKNLIPLVGYVRQTWLSLSNINLLLHSFAWTMRIIGVILLAVVGACNLVRHFWTPSPDTNSHVLYIDDEKTIAACEREGRLVQFRLF